MLQTINLQGGVFRDYSEYAPEGRYYSANRVRFRDGAPEPIGGWTTAYSFADVDGLPRAVLVWSKNDGTIMTAIGTTTKLYIIAEEAQYDITPLDDSGTLGTDPFTTTNGSTSVTVADTAHGRAVGDTVIFSGATATGGITIDGTYTVTSTIDPDNYTIAHTSAATSDSTGGGSSVAYEYELSIGAEDSSEQYGYGAGAYGAEEYGDIRTEANIDLRVWNLEPWGEDLIANPRGGKIYTWDASSGFSSNRATVIAGAPTAEDIVVSPDDRHLIAIQEDGDPMGIRWCDQEDFTTWTAAADNTAGERRLLGGSKLIGAVQGKGETMIFSDTSLFSHRYTGGQFVFSTRRVGEIVQPMGINAMISYGGSAYWMGRGRFQYYDGRIQDIPCSVLRYVFDDLDETQGDKVFACINKEYSELWWFYPSESGDGEIDRYVILSLVDGTWSIGMLERTCWAAKGLLDKPLALDSAGATYFHEQEAPTDENGASIGEWVESAAFDIGDGEQLMFVNRAIPDFLLESGSVDVTFKTRKYPNGSETTKGPYSFSTTTTKIHPRLRGRQCVIRYDGTGAVWRAGRIRLDMRPDGRR